MDMSTASPNVAETAHGAREAAADIGKVAAHASGDVQSDLQALRDDFGRLAEQVADIVASKGTAAWQRARSRVEDMVADAQDKGSDAAGAMREVSDNVVDAISQSVKQRPYATLAVVAGLAFVIGSVWRR